MFSGVGNSSESPYTVPPEDAPLKPLSPYAVSKVAGDFLSRTYWNSYGIRSVVSRSFSHEGPGRGANFVTSSIVNQVLAFNKGTIDRICLGDVTAFRDWSWVGDVIEGYLILAASGNPGEVYNQGSMRTNSVLTYLLWALEATGFVVDSIESVKGNIKVNNPTEEDTDNLYGCSFDKTKVDRLLLDGDITFSLEDEGIQIKGSGKTILLEFDKSLYRPAEVPILLSNSRKIQKIGAHYSTKVRNIITSQLQYSSRDMNSSTTFRTENK